MQLLWMVDVGTTKVPPLHARRDLRRMAVEYGVPEGFRDTFERQFATAYRSTWVRGKRILCDGSAADMAILRPDGTCVLFRVRWEFPCVDWRPEEVLPEDYYAM